MQHLLGFYQISPGRWMENDTYDSVHRMVYPYFTARNNTDPVYYHLDRTAETLEQDMEEHIPDLLRFQLDEER